jgi:hypothetical protein
VAAAHAAGTSTFDEKTQSLESAGSPMIAPLAGCGRAVTGTRTRAAATTERPRA